MGIDGKELRWGVIGWDSQRESCKEKVIRGDGGDIGWELQDGSCGLRVVSVGLVGWACGLKNHPSPFKC